MVLQLVVLLVLLLEVCERRALSLFLRLITLVDYGDIQSRDPEDKVTSATVGNGRAMLSNRLSHFLNIKVCPVFSRAYATANAREGAKHDY